MVNNLAYESCSFGAKGQVFYVFLFNANAWFEYVEFI